MVVSGARAAMEVTAGVGREGSVEMWVVYVLLDYAQHEAGWFCCLTDYTPHSLLAVCLFFSLSPPLLWTAVPELSALLLVFHLNRLKVGREEEGNTILLYFENVEWKTIWIRNICTYCPGSKSMVCLEGTVALQASVFIIIRPFEICMDKSKRLNSSGKNSALCLDPTLFHINRKSSL